LVSAKLSGFTTSGGAGERETFEGQHRETV
jgi:hypothetical protein